MKENLAQIFRRQAQKYGNRLAVEKRLNGVWHGWSWEEYYDKARSVGLGLYSLGIRRGDRVALLSDNRLEWIASDMGIIGIGACTIPIYVTLPSHEVAYIINNSDAKVFIAENKAAVEKALHHIQETPLLEKIVVIDPEGCDLANPLIMTFEQLQKMGRDLQEKEGGLFEKLTDEIQVDDLLTFVYTSGTTGPPKGAMISHKNILAVFDGLDAVVPAYDTDETVPFLPLCHVFERVAGHFYGMKVGITAHYTESFDTIVEDIAAKRPTIVLAVPRVCEKIYAKIMSEVKKQPEWKQKMFAWAKNVGAQVSQLKEKKQALPLGLKIQYSIAYPLVFKKLSDKLGGRVRWMTAAGAPLSRDIADFFNASGIFVIEGYGMTETTAPVTLNTINDYRFGTTGKPLPCNQIKIAPDGEILVKGDNVITGYWKMPEQTKDAFTDDGWLMSGDIGVIDTDGFLSITDRKKDLIITAGGKNIAPQNIEGMFMKNPLFENVVIIGDRRKFLSALFTLNREEMERLASVEGISYTDPTDLYDRKEFRAIVDKAVEEVNQQLARVEAIKQYRILKDSFSTDTGELTPSLKVKRKVINEKFKDVIESMYPKEL
ncbi:MAG: AMP-dependent synthetase/ligase [Desulfomonilia bacterium]